MHDINHINLFVNTLLFIELNYTYIIVYKLYIYTIIFIYLFIYLY